VGFRGKRVALPPAWCCRVKRIYRRACQHSQPAVAPSNGTGVSTSRVSPPGPQHCYNPCNAMYHVVCEATPVYYSPSCNRVVAADSALPRTRKQAQFHARRSGERDESASHVTGAVRMCARMDYVQRDVTTNPLAVAVVTAARFPGTGAACGTAAFAGRRGSRAASVTESGRWRPCGCACCRPGSAAFRRTSPRTASGASRCSPACAAAHPRERRVSAVRHAPVKKNAEFRGSFGGVGGVGRRGCSSVLPPSIVAVPGGV
jgi:hypothetical protein